MQRNHDDIRETVSQKIQDINGNSTLQEIYDIVRTMHKIPTQSLTGFDYTLYALGYTLCATFNSARGAHALAIVQYKLAIECVHSKRTDQLNRYDYYFLGMNSLLIADALTRLNLLGNVGKYIAQSTTQLLAIHADLTPDDICVILECLNDIADAFYQKNKPMDAIRTLRLAKRVLIDTDMHALQRPEDFARIAAAIHCNLANNYYELKNYEKALHYYKRSTSLFKRLPADAFTAEDHYWLAEKYAYLCDAQLIAQFYSSARKALNEGLIHLMLTGNNQILREEYDELSLRLNELYNTLYNPGDDADDEAELFAALPLKQDAGSNLLQFSQFAPARNAPAEPAELVEQKAFGLGKLD